jgi:diacylglycerol kinase family enzyme
VTIGAAQAVGQLFVGGVAHGEVLARRPDYIARGEASVVHEHASILDGHLDLYGLDPRAVWKLAFLFDTFQRGRHGVWAEVQTSRCVEFNIRTRKPQPIKADGDLVTETPAHFIVRPQAISVFVP